MAFDYKRELFRFDSEHPMFVRSTTSDGSSKTEGIERPKLRSILTPEFSADWSRTTNKNFQYVHVRKPDHALDTAASFHPFDVREAGLVHYMNFNRQQGIEKTISNYLRLKPVEVRKQGQDQKWLVLKHDWGHFELLVDTKRGMTVTEMRSIEPNVTYPGRDTVAKVEWEERNGVWVPRKYRIEFQTGDEYRDHRYYDFTLSWKLVNQPVNDALFDYKKLEGIPDGTEIIDTRVDPQQVIGRYGPERKYEPLVKPPILNRTMRWLLLANFALLLLVLVLYGLKRRRQIGT